jgi:hypothetical protein
MGTLHHRNLQHPRSIPPKSRPQLLSSGRDLEKNLGNKILAENQHLPLACGAQQYSHMGQSQEKRLHRPLQMPVVRFRGGNSKSSPKPVHLQLKHLGPQRLPNENHRQESHRTPGNSSRLEKHGLSIPSPQQNLATTPRVYYLAYLERKEQTNLPNSHQDLARSLDHHPLQS